MAIDKPEPSSASNKNSSLNKLQWSELEEEDDSAAFATADLGFLLPPPQVTGPDENGIKKVVEYKLNEQGHRVRVTTATRVRKVASARVSKRAVERRGWAKFGDAVDEDVGSRLTVVFVMYACHVNPCEKAEEAKSSGDSLAQLGKGAALMVCRSCGMKGDHWTARCPYPGLAHQTQLLTNNTPPSTDAAASTSPSTQGTSYVPPSRREGAERSVVGSDMRRRNDDYAIRIDNLSEDTQDSDLVDLCRPFGQVLRAHVPKDYATGLGRGYGYVNFLRREDAERAINKLDGYGYDNLILRVEWSAPRTN
ncbi:hypothetical protein RHGRI_015298 [Rhododendron griersonianum]|uniref:Eukaryotic translation initiation factor 3 subunit G n=1 Tax=Rhododendron griersonianum TaxID=479676 RepID=A0AAV6KCX8_9ERIC|nr:hypothetical protein RHGRI_015298 [Rhododendron griersonianum]